MPRPQFERFALEVSSYGEALDMSRLAVSVVGAGLCALLSACEKPTPFEYTGPAGSSPPPVAAPSLDATVFVPVDAGGADAAPETPTGEFTQPALLKAIADCALERHRGFVQLATALRDATRSHAEAPSQEALGAAQQAWRAAIAAWQELELFRFGPAGTSGVAGGKGLRNNIYFYPDLNNCQVDQVVVSRAYTMGGQVLSVGAKGLGALEYLLFYAGTANSCPGGITINTPPSEGAPTPWQELDQAELTRRRTDYAAAVAADVLVQASAIVTAWEPGQGDFYTQFTTAGAGSTLFPRAVDAFNVVDNAMFYLDTELKDYKVAIPAGISDACLAEVCPEDVESRFSGMANQNMRSNISGFRLLFQGCGSNYSGLGFDDWLRSIGVGELADRINGAIVAADTAVATLPQPFEATLSSDVTRARSIHAAIKAISDPFKTEFFSVLNLDRPSAAQGDND
jgi:predicted lipoprotein